MTNIEITKKTMTTAQLGFAADHYCSLNGMQDPYELIEFSVHGDAEQRKWFVEFAARFGGPEAKEVSPGRFLVIRRAIVAHNLNRLWMEMISVQSALQAIH